MTEIDYEARVAKGIALLDEKAPDWAAKIQLDLLDIWDGDYCVTAQLSGHRDFVTGMKMLDLEQGANNSGSYTLHGFNAEDPGAPGLPENYDQGDAFQTLNRIWKREIRARQNGDS